MNGLRLSTQVICTLASLCLAATPALAKPLTQHWGQIYAVAFSPDGTFVASASAKHLEVHEVQTGKQLSRMGLQHGPRCIAFAPSGDKLVVDANLIDVNSAQVVETLGKHSGVDSKINAAAFAPDGKTLAIAASSGPVRLIAPSGGKLLHTLNGHSGPVYAVAFSPDGTVVATAGGDRIRLWSVKWGRSVGDFRSELKHVRALAFDPTGASIAVAGQGRRVELWSVQGQRRLRSARTDGTTLATLAFTSDGKTLVGGGTGLKIRLWTASTLDAAGSITRKGAGSVTALAIGPNGRRAVVGDSTGAVRLVAIVAR